MRLNAYESTKIYKERVKAWYDKHISHKQFEIGQNILLFNSHLKLFPGKLKLRWSGPYVVKQVFPYSAMEIQSDKGNSFKVYGQRLKVYFAGTLVPK